MKYMSDGRYRMALVRMRDRIASGLELHREDSDAIGDKYTHCSWGMCSNDPTQWPDAGDHLFPIDFVRNGRVSATRQPHQTCPLQDNAETGGPAWGCFYHCYAFQPKRPTLIRRTLETVPHAVELFGDAIEADELLGVPGPTREEALQLYDQRITAIGALPEVCACDGVGTVADPDRGQKTLPCPSCRPEEIGGSW